MLLIPPRLRFILWHKSVNGLVLYDDTLLVFLIAEILASTVYDHMSDGLAEERKALFYFDKVFYGLTGLWAAVERIMGENFKEYTRSYDEQLSI